MKVILAILALLLAQPVLANEQGFGVPAIKAYPASPPVSRMGKVTGGSCAADSDCILGCKAGSDDEIFCLTLQEASNSCVDPDAPPTSDYVCACLPDVKRCGQVFDSITQAAKEKAKREKEAAEAAARAKANAPPTAEAKPVKKVKKTPKKKSTKRRVTKDTRKNDACRK